MQNTIDTLIKDALKAKNPIALEGYRAVKSKMMLELTKGDPKIENNQALFLACIKKELKERVEENSFQKDSTSHVFVKNSTIISELEQHLPKQLGEFEQDALIAEAIEKTGATGPQFMGKVMGQLKDYKDKMDMARASKIIKDKLSS